MPVKLLDYQLKIKEKKIKYYGKATVGPSNRPR